MIHGKRPRVGGVAEVEQPWNATQSLSKPEVASLPNSSITDVSPRQHRAEHARVAALHARQHHVNRPRAVRGVALETLRAVSAPFTHASSCGAGRVALGSLSTSVTRAESPRARAP